MPTHIRGWQCDCCKHVYSKKNDAELCENRHRVSSIKILLRNPYRDLSFPGCGSPDCNGECEISDMDFNN